MHTNTDTLHPSDRRRGERRSSGATVCQTKAPVHCPGTRTKVALGDAAFAGDADIWRPAARPAAANPARPPALRRTAARRDRVGEDV